jgi:hypothetical protein
MRLKVLSFLGTLLSSAVFSQNTSFKVVKTYPIQSGGG